MFRLRTTAHLPSDAPSCRLVPLAAIALLTVGCGGADRHDSIPPSVILISLDTVRADNLGAYGAPAGATPALDALCAAADRYEQCISAAPWTMPTHASMFTGLMPFEHGAHTFLPGEGHRGDNVFALNERFETLAEALGARGYRTAGIVSNAVYLRPGLGLEQGFRHWDVHRTPAVQVNERALRWLEENGAGVRPSFLFMNFMDAHRPYATGDRDDRPAEKLDRLIEAVMVEGEDASELASEVRSLHQKAVSRLDQRLGEFFDQLKAKGLYDRSLIIVTSDHGESFGAHGIVEHSKDVYEDLLRVPLIVKWPGQVEAKVVETRASSMHIPGLVARALVGTDAASLTAVFPRTPAGRVLAMNFYSRGRDLRAYGDRFRRRRTALYEGSLKLIAGTDGLVELYDLAVDPDEMNNLVVERPKVAQAMVLRLNESLAAPTAYEGDRALPDAMSPAQVEEMSGMGY